MTTESNCYIANSMDKNFLRILNNRYCNIDELNYLMKGLDGLCPKKIEKFYAIVFAEKPKTIAEFINLSFNMHCYSLISDFNNLEFMGNDLYLSKKLAVATKELDELDGEAFAMEEIRNISNYTITPYGILYKNGNEMYQAYDDRNFLPYKWNETMLTVELKTSEDEFQVIL
jgi:hypothetical protein